MVIGKVPVGAFLDTDSVKCEEPEPGLAIELGLNTPVTPVGTPVAESATTALKPPETVVVTTAYAACPRARDPAAGETEMAKAPAGAVVTVSVTVAVCVIPPPVAVTVMGYVPAAVVEATASVSAEVPEPGAAMDAGLKVAVTPAGCPLAVKATAELKPPETVVVMVEEPLLPAATETIAGEAASVNAGTGVAVTVSETEAVWVMLSPLPVTVIG